MVQTSTDRIFVEHLSFRGKHGVGDEERSKEQEFIVDISADIDIRAAAQSDKLSDTVDWMIFHDIARDAVQGKSYYLIERLAEVIAQKALENERIACVTVSVRKREMLEGGLPGVTITRP